MKSNLWILGVALLAAFQGGVARAAEQDSDTVTLKDGRVLQGQVMEERSGSLVILVDGKQRTFERNFIAKVVYGGGAGAAAMAPAGAPDGSLAGAGAMGGGQTVPAHGDLAVDLSNHYHVPLADVVWVRNQGVSDKDLPLVYYIAVTAQVAPRMIVGMHQRGMSWEAIAAQYEVPLADSAAPQAEGAEAVPPTVVYYDEPLFVDGVWGWPYGYGYWGYGGVWWGNGYGWRGGWNGGWHNGWNNGWHGTWGGRGTWGGSGSGGWGGRVPLGGSHAGSGSGFGGRGSSTGARGIGGSGSGGGSGGGAHGGGGGSSGGENGLHPR